MKENWKMKNGKCSISMPEGMDENFAYLVNRHLHRSPSGVVQDFLEPSYRLWLDEKKNEAGKSIPPKSHPLHDMPIHTETRARHKITRLIGNLFRAAGAEVVPNGLRHSFGSYLLAQTNDAAYVGAQMGQWSMASLLAHYRRAATPADARKYFSICPESAPGFKK